MIPNLTLIVVLGRAWLRRPRAGDLGHPGGVHHDDASSLAWPIASLGFLLSMTQEAMTAATTGSPRILDAPTQIDDGPNPASSGPRSRGTGRLELRDVGFRFPDSDAWVLRGVTVTVEPGETLALVGATGLGVGARRVGRHDSTTSPKAEFWIDGNDIRDLSLSACAAPSPSPSRIRRCSRCRSPRTSPWGGRWMTRRR